MCWDSFVKFVDASIFQHSFALKYFQQCNVTLIRYELKHRHWTFVNPFVMLQQAATGSTTGRFLVFWQIPNYAVVQHNRGRCVSNKLGTRPQDWGKEENLWWTLSWSVPATAQIIHSLNNRAMSPTPRVMAGMLNKLQINSRSTKNAS